MATSCTRAQAAPQDVTTYVRDTFYPATVLLYSQDAGGDMSMHCTATAIEKTKTGYIFVSAAHCACDEDEDTHTVMTKKSDFYVTNDEGEKTFLRAKVVGCGMQETGDDFALFQVDTARAFPIVALGKDPDKMDSVVNVAAPLGLSKQVFTGIVSTGDLDRPVVEKGINWTHAVMLEIPAAGGSSGSAVVCENQRAICAFIVGVTKNTPMVYALPVSRLIKLRSQIESKAYDKYWLH